MDRFTSLELSKRLAEAGCKLKFETGYFKDYRGEWGDLTEIDRYDRLYGRGTFNSNWIESFEIMNDICVKYCKEFFGEEMTITSGWTERASEWTFSTPPSGFVMKQKAYIHRSQEILRYMQEGSQEAAESYLWKHCIFNKKLEDL